MSVSLGPRGEESRGRAGRREFQETMAVNCPILERRGAKRNTDWRLQIGDYRLGQNRCSRSWRKLGSQTSAAPHTATSHNEELILQEASGSDDTSILERGAYATNAGFSPSRRLQGQDEAVSRFWASGRTRVLVHRRRLLPVSAPGARGEGPLRDLLCKDANPVREAPSQARSPPKGCPCWYHTQGAGCRDVHFGEGATDAQLVAVLRAKVWDRGDRHSQAVPTAQEAGQVQAGGRHV